MAVADAPVVAVTGDVSWGWLALPGLASLGAGAINAAAIGVHRDHRQAVVTFAVLAAFQVGWGAVALTHRGRGALVALVGAAGHLVAAAGWAQSKAGGIGFIDGLDAVEGIQFADATAAALAVVAVATSLGLHFGRVRAIRRPPPVWTFALAMAAVVVASVTVPAMVSASTHRHAAGAGAGAADHGGAPPAAPGPAVPPKPYDPTRPIDLGGVPGVTPQQQARAENLIAVTLLRLPKYTDPAVAYAAGFRSIQDAGTGYEHYINWSYLDDGRILDPDFPESLVYRAHRDGRRELQAAMFMLTPVDTLETVPDVGGALTQWHIHDNLCFTDEPGDYKVRGLTNADGTCTPPLVKATRAPMIHVWTVSHPCGPFAALEGLGAGQIRPGETRLCDHAHGA